MMIAPAFLLTQVDHLGHDVCNPRFTLLDWSTSRRNRWSTSPEYAACSSSARFPPRKLLGVRCPCF
jgi:hypothetical protein